MKRTLVVVAAVVGFATAVSASSFTVTTHLGTAQGAATNTFTEGETIVLVFSGIAESGGATTFGGVFGILTYNGDVTDFIANSQTPMFATVSPLLFEDDGGPDASYFLNQSNSSTTAPSTENQIATVTLLAHGAGSSTVGFGAGFDFFGDYRSGTTAGVHSFTVIPIPEPATAALIGLGVLGLVLGGRRRA